MGYYNVVSPCVVGKLHYARPTVVPIQVDDETAAPLVGEGFLKPYPDNKIGQSTVSVAIERSTESVDADNLAAAEKKLEETRSKRRSRSRSED